MNRRALLSALLGTVALPALAAEPTPADEADLDRLAAYLNGIHSLRARFEQVAPDGGVSTGTVWLQRPGRIRFQYDPPTPLLLVSDGTDVIFHDSQLKQTTRIPLARTPLSILLAEHIAFSGPVRVTDIQRLPNQIQVSVVRAASPGDGLIALVFSLSPLAVWQWTVVDPQRKITRVTLSQVQTGVQIDPGLFVFHEASAG